jgi:hypothetical protein
VFNFPTKYLLSFELKAYLCVSVRMEWTLVKEFLEELNSLWIKVHMLLSKQIFFKNTVMRMDSNRHYTQGSTLKRLKGISTLCQGKTS